MSRSGVPVELQPGAAPGRAVTAWHSESALLVRSFEYGAGPQVPAAVAERIVLVDDEPSCFLGITPQSLGPRPPPRSLGDTHLSAPRSTGIDGLTAAIGSARVVFCTNSGHWRRDRRAQWNGRSTQGVELRKPEEVPDAMSEMRERRFE
jgi:hypothetical protein